MTKTITQASPKRGGRKNKTYKGRQTAWRRKQSLEIMKTFLVLAGVTAFLIWIGGSYKESVEIEAWPTATFTAIEAKAEVVEVEKPKLINGVIREVTAYNVGIEAQTDSSPCIGATGENLCHLINKGVKICAANFVPKNTKLYVEGVGECIVKDRMNKRYANRVDIAMGPDELQRALRFGLQNLEVKILSE